VELLQFNKPKLPVPFDTFPDSLKVQSNCSIAFRPRRVNKTVLGLSNCMLAEEKSSFCIEALEILKANPVSSRISMEGIFKGI